MEYRNDEMTEIEKAKEAASYGRQGMHPFVKVLLIILIGAVIGVGGFFGCRFYMTKIAAPSAGALSAPVIDELEETESAAVTPSAAPVLELSVTTDDVSDAASCMMPAVVAIECECITTSYNFFGQAQQYKSTSGGTGFIVSQSSELLYIVTNNHVVDGAQTIEVTFGDNEKCNASVVGADSDYDLAVITVRFTDIPAKTRNMIKVASLGDSSALRVGAMSVAIGNALGYGQTVTVGYISALDREVEVDGITRKLIQTDAAINPGNSGGPLINANGQVIGINSVKFASEGVEGMGYAIPITEAVPIINELIGYEELADSEKGYLGIEGKDVSQTYAVGFNMPLGVYIFSVLEDSPAEYAGLRVGDIITAINGRSVTTMNELQNRLGHIKAGTDAEITFRRQLDGKYVEQKLTVTLGNRP